MSASRARRDTWCPEFAHGWYNGVHFSAGCPKCNPTEPLAKPKKASGSVALNWQWCPNEGHGWYEGMNRDGFFRDCDKCPRDPTAEPTASAPETRTWDRRTTKVRQPPKPTWCPELAHGWFDAVQFGTECPKCNPAEPAKPKKASGSVALNWQWCPTEGHGWYEGINRDGFFRDCGKCASVSAASAS